MILKAVQYNEYQGLPNAWDLERVDFNKINLVVGRNATGKTRTLNIVGGLAKVFTQSELKYRNGYYKAEFENEGVTIVYELSYKHLKVTRENLVIDGNPKITRDGDSGEMWNEDVESMLRFEIPSTELAISKKDNIQFPYLNILHDWGARLRFFRFNTELGKGVLEIQDSKLIATDPGLQEADEVLSVYKKGVQALDRAFIHAIKADMNRVGYNIAQIKIGEISSIVVQTGLTDKILGLNVKEDDCGWVDQRAMSMGMFRALSILIQFNYLQKMNISGTIVIDDIGEGLDFERSTALIDLLIEKANDADIQLFLSTNDRFVMNKTPLEYWQILSRRIQTVSSHNHSNSSALFEKFRFTGLSNFDLFSSNLYSDGIDLEEDAD